MALLPNPAHQSTDISLVKALPLEANLVKLAERQSEPKVVA